MNALAMRSIRLEINSAALLKRRRLRSFIVAPARNGRGCGIRLIQFLVSISEYATGHDQHVDLLRTLENIVDLGIPHPLLE